MILSLSGLCLENLPTGMLRRTTIDGDRAHDLIRAAADGDRLVGIFEFGAVPDPERERRFDQLLAVLKSVYDIALDRCVFFTAIDLAPEDAEAGPIYYANPLQLYRVAAGRPLLIVSYFLSPGRDRFLDMDVAPNSLGFDLIEAVAETDTN